MREATKMQTKTLGFMDGYRVGVLGFRLTSSDRLGVQGQNVVFGVVV